MGGTIFLVGMMGAGKTTIGRALARKLGLEFADTDRELVGRTGVAVATIFEIEGEAGFRKRETALLAELSQRDGAVIATGGGAVISEENRRLMRENGTVVYLRARLESLWERTRHDSSRPLLATADPKATLAALLEQREPLYLEVAHVVVDTGPQSPATLATKLAATLRERTGAEGAP
jgi:shikimate kinase